MSPSTALLAILGALLVGAISPGPSFLLVSRISVTRSRLHGLAAAVGMGAGGCVFAGLALLGLAALLNQVESLNVVLKLLGGAYLVWLGLRMWTGAKEPLSLGDVAVPEGRSLMPSFSSALLTQVSNPKAAVVYGSIFAAMLPVTPPVWLLLVLPALAFLIETGWYAIVALAFSAKHPRALYLRAKISVDRLAGTVMGLLGLRLIVDAVAVRRL